LGISNQSRAAAADVAPSPLRVCLKFLQEGHDPSAALEFVADWGEGSVKHTFQEYAKRLKQGRPLDTILEDIAEAYPSPETELLLAMIQSRLQTGVFPAIAPEIMTEAEGLESHLREDMEVLVGPGRRWTLGLVWAGILGGAVLLIALPQYSNTLLVSPVGRIVFCAAIILDVVGFMWAAALLHLQTRIEAELKRR
jgi:Flp pilus assembly protein TadB